MECWFLRGWRSIVLVDSIDLVLTAIIAPIVSGLVLFFAGLFVGRKLERKERSRQDDQTRIYEPLYAQVLKLISSEDSAKRGFMLNTPDTQVIDEIAGHGLFVPDRHRKLREDVLKLADLELKCNRTNFAFNVALTEAIETNVPPQFLDPQRIDSMKSDTALNNALLSNDQAAGAARLEEISGHRVLLRSGDHLGYWVRFFDSMEERVAGPRSDLNRVQEALLERGRRVKIGLESALKRGKYRPPHSTS